MQPVPKKPVAKIHPRTYEEAEKAREKILRKEMLTDKEASSLGIVGDFSTEKDEAVFHTGDEEINGPNLKAAVKHAQSNKKKTIYDTADGRNLSKAQMGGLLSKKGSRKGWTHASCNFAREASGDVDVFKDGLDPLAKTTYTQQEEPILKASSKIGKIKPLPTEE